MSYASRMPIPRTNPNKTECLYQYAIDLDPKKIFKAKKKRWDGGILKTDMRFYCGAIEILGNSDRLIIILVAETFSRDFRPNFQT